MVYWLACNAVGFRLNSWNALGMADFRVDILRISIDAPRAALTWSK